MDPFSTLLTLISPRAVDSKIVTGQGPWSITYENVVHTGFGLVLEGEAILNDLHLKTGDFLLLPPNPGFTMRHQQQQSFRLLGGYFDFEPAHADLLAHLLPAPIHIPQAQPHDALIELIAREANAHHPGRELILQRLVEILLIETLRNRSHVGLLRGLADPTIAPALTALHHTPAHPWTLAELADRCGLSRSSFCQHFTRTVGTPPKEYLISWRLALAKDLSQKGQKTLEEVAETVGYQSASALSTAFRRHYGHSPRHLTAR
ncbi:MAG: AraC family transcriptional regulator [Candidatus Eremiobacteraeota bacterium]|nr:AraC family transcriptional regulator [Candidatus Eremiobacteraeota bacterium]